MLTTQLDCTSAHVQTLKWNGTCSKVPKGAHYMNKRLKLLTFFQPYYGVVDRSIDKEIDRHTVYLNLKSFSFVYNIIVLRVYVILSLLGH